MSNYQIKEQCYSYEAVNAKTHLQASSPEFLSNQELIELALDVSPERSLDLIQDIDSISEINFLIEGLDESNAIQLQAMFELCRRFCLSTISKKESISSSYDLAQRLINEMKKFAAADRIRCRVIDLTPLQILEMTRKKISPPIIEQLAAASFICT